jgi:hypothetical protein
MRIARRRVAPPPAARLSAPRVNATVVALKGASIIVITSARIVPA